MVLCSHYAAKKSLFPTRTTSGHRVVKLQLPRPLGLPQSEDDVPLTHKLEIHACIMAMEHVYTCISSEK